MIKISLPFDAVRKLTPECEQAFAAWAAACSAERSAKADLREAFRKTPHYQAMSAMSNNGVVDGDDRFIIEHRRFGFGKGFVVADDTPTPYIDPKTMNQLLNSSLLTDAEKRALLQRHNILPE